MSIPWSRVPALAGMAVMLSLVSTAKEGYAVKIIERQDNETQYTYYLPGHSSSTSNTNVNCYGNSSNVNCSGTTRTNGTETPARSGSYNVKGSTMTLELPDGRIAVVNCQSKYKLKGDYINRRSCRAPLVNDIWVEFDGDNAKLEWSVSLDGKKTASETYKVLAVINKP